MTILTLSLVPCLFTDPAKELRALPILTMATSLPTEARGTKRKGEDVDNEDIISPEAQKIKTFIRGGFHKVLAKLGYHREISKSDLRSDHKITNSYVFLILFTVAN